MLGRAVSRSSTATASSVLPRLQVITRGPLTRRCRAPSSTAALVAGARRLSRLIRRTGNYLYVPETVSSMTPPGTGPKTDTSQSLRSEVRVSFASFQWSLRSRRQNDNPELVGHVDNGSSGDGDVSDATVTCWRPTMVRLPARPAMSSSRADEGSTIEILYNYTPSAEVAHAAAGDRPETNSSR